MPIPDPIITGSLLILAGAKPQCEMPKLTEINVRPFAQELKYDYSQGMDQLQGQASGTIDPYSFHGVTRTQGLMKGAITLKQEVKLDYQTFPRYGAACIWYDEINIDIEIDPTIVIAKEVYKDRCMYHAVLEHEMKHVNEDRRVVSEYAQIIAQKVYKALKERGFKSGIVKAEHAQEIATRMQTVVYQTVEHEYKKLELDRAERQRAIDNIQEYERVSAECPDYGQSKSRTRRR